MSSVIVTADIVGSTDVKSRYDQATAAKRIRAALELLKTDLCAADATLHCPAPYAGDSILLVGGLDAVAIYQAAVVHQAVFRCWHYQRMPLKIALGHGMYEMVQTDGRVSYHGTDLDMLYGLNAWCPPGGLVVSQSMYAILQDAGFGGRFHECREHLKGFGPAIFYESNGDYAPPRVARQPYRNRRRTHWLPRTSAEWNDAYQTLGITAAVILLAVLLYLGLKATPYL